ncbi:hypothetical protein ACIP98_06110 [Streptomyces sp. NPDC088354]|uniref:hypothetical protein n=1 Tax=unclassified Streptomyces TaxID=2593676 RepID=UPI0029A4AE08|nr:hypothetical protein [Streptomyces sp. MI02-7b]MDX3073846.1 hypothetical protein [Streptomyces sp. MI02-7b]
MLAKRRRRGSGKGVCLVWSLLTALLLAVTAFTAAHGAFESGALGREERVLLVECEKRSGERGRAPTECTGRLLGTASVPAASHDPVIVRYPGEPGQVVRVVRTWWGTLEATDHSVMTWATGVFLTLLPLTGAALCARMACRGVLRRPPSQGRT